MPETTFLKAMSTLESSQGNILRSFSAAALKIMNSLLQHPAQQCATFRLEETETSQILDQPKNSPGLLRLLE